jgi:hypothetical protein
MSDNNTIILRTRFKLTKKIEAINPYPLDY